MGFSRQSLIDNIIIFFKAALKQHALILEKFREKKCHIHDACLFPSFY